MRFCVSSHSYTARKNGLPKPHLHIVVRRILSFFLHRDSGFSSSSSPIASPNSNEHTHPGAKQQKHQNATIFKETSYTGKANHRISPFLLLLLLLSLMLLLLSLMLLLLDASSHLYKRVCPSIRPSVGPSVRPSVRMNDGMNEWKNSVHENSVHGKCKWCRSWTAYSIPFMYAVNLAFMYPPFRSRAKPGVGMPTYLFVSACRHFSFWPTPLPTLSRCF